MGVFPTHLANSEAPRSFRPGKSGSRVQSKSVVDIFTILVIQLQLSDKAPKQKYNIFAKQHYPFSFDVSKAIEEMSQLKLNIVQETVTTTISYTIKPELAFNLIKKFFSAKLLHNPEARTENHVSLDSVVQVTPKGVAIVSQVCKRLGVKRDKMPYVVYSNFNTMNLFQYDRSESNRLLYSEYVINILVTNMMANAPNVWSPSQKPPIVQIVFEHETCDFFSHPTSSNEDILPPTIDTPKVFVSPFHHKYFTNMASDSHVQYYESNTGIRLYKNRTLKTEDKEITINYCFSGKSVVQWLMDCTALLSIPEAMEIGRLMVKYELIIPVTDDDSGADFTNHRDALYTLTENGRQICRWESLYEASDVVGSQSTDVSSQEGNFSGEGRSSTESTESCKQVSLKQILSDPGMRCLFKVHLEKECSGENVEAYIQLVDFAKSKKRTSQLWKLHNNCQSEAKRALISEAIEKHTASSYSMAFHLYSTYLSSESECDVNLDYNLRQDVRKVMQIRGDWDVPDNVSEYLKTPTYEKILDWETKDDQGRDEKTKQGENIAEQEAKPPGGVLEEETDGSPADLTIRLDDIYTVFAKVAHSIYKLMETDSYPRFIRSEEYMYALGIKTHKA
ncbi:Regulator of G protein signaling domain family protein [Clavispora lusitaniae]|uniref:Uncharacterized protein n=1 Tax=Clavispora lusitaniae (strain ATCC 42720) TaxID=306902 RepID=C4Y9U1_CLAL4|nr:uncharacterized protein CLUG_05162 [Clavispora lusitaniae ATCC 42720]EEQ41034.1 hypothetical protein CLUG_05162 [Clavispora lusitaniae ATCC 42720]KAF7580778.1 Regulator of G protein signaling domain family protein [Clavispora lusitaniae]